MPPVAEKFPGVYGVPSAWKNKRRGPSDVKVSLTLVPLKGLGKGPTAGVAATLNASAAALWPCVCPAVAIERRPRKVFRWRKRFAAVDFFTMTMRGLVVLDEIRSNGS